MSRIWLERYARKGYGRNTIESVFKKPDQPLSESLPRSHFDISDNEDGTATLGQFW